MVRYLHEHVADIVHLLTSSDVRGIRLAQEHIFMCITYYIYIYLYVYIYIYIHLYIYICVYMYTCVYVCMYVCIYTYIIDNTYVD